MQGIHIGAFKGISMAIVSPVTIEEHSVIRMFFVCMRLNRTSQNKQVSIVRPAMTSGRAP